MTDLTDNLASDDYMKRALTLATKAAALGEVPVGAVVVDPKSGDIIAEACNAPIAEHDPTAHAEILALRRAGQMLRNYRLPGLHLYVTLEPCAMCAGAISFARIEKLVFAASDPKGGGVMHGPKFFDQPTCHWRTQWEQDVTHVDVSRDLLRSFFKNRRR